MQNYNIKMGTSIGAGIIVLIILFQVIIGSTIDSIVLFYSVLSGLIVGVIAALSLRLISLNEEKIISAITLDLDEEESIIIEGAAKYHFESKVYKGKLFLTSRRLIFKTLEPKRSEAVFVGTLKSIKNIDLRRSLRLMGMSLEINADLAHNKFMVDYPSDWKGVIESQIKHSQDIKKM